MANLKEIRLRIKSVKSTQQTTKAMKMVSAAKLKKAQDGIIQLRPYATRLKSVLQNLVLSMENFNNEYAVQREVKTVLLVVVTSNKGLCGAFNSAIFKLTRQTIEEKYADLAKAGKVKLLFIGKKGFEAMKKMPYEIIDNEYKDLFSRLSFDKVAETAEMVMEGFKNGEWDKVDIIYNEFKNVATQIRQVETFLPITPDKTAVASKTEYIFEPDKESLLETLIPKILKLQFYRSVLESNASEHGARMIAMDAATENAGAMINQLKLVYNRERQAAITKEILEIVGGAEALNN